MTQTLCYSLCLLSLWHMDEGFLSLLVILIHFHLISCLPEEVVNCPACSFHSSTNKIKQMWICCGLRASTIRQKREKSQLLCEDISNEQLLALTQGTSNLFMKFYFNKPWFPPFFFLSLIQMQEVTFGIWMRQMALTYLHSKHTLINMRQSKPPHNVKSFTKC